MIEITGVHRQQTREAQQLLLLLERPVLLWLHWVARLEDLQYKQATLDWKTSSINKPHWEMEPQYKEDHGTDTGAVKLPGPEQITGVIGKITGVIR